jgi:purine-nucleoside phosphorylase
VGIYLRVKPGACAERVLVAGDPGRITRLASLLEGATVVTDNRGLLGYTGRCRGEPVSLQSTGMGCRSMAMVGAELLEYGVRTIVRIGTCSAFGRGVRNGDLVVVTGSAAADGTTQSFAEGMPFVAVPDFRLTSALVEAARANGLPTHVGPVVTVDVEPHLSTRSTQSWREHGLLAVEMESAALFYLALRATGRVPHRVEAACVLTVSDGLEGHPDGPQRYLSDAELEAATDAMHKESHGTNVERPCPERWP